MRNYAARQNKKDGKWFFTYTDSEMTGMVYNAGYCQEDDGHKTKEEAEACYRKFLLDERTVFVQVIDPQRHFPCEAKGCNENTQGGAFIDSQFTIPLCKVHRTRVQADKLLPKFTVLAASQV